MLNNVTNQREFAALFREEFCYLERRDTPNGASMLYFYESVMDCPWEYKCGYWSVFINFYVMWDIRDSWFSLFVEPSKNDQPPSPRGERPFVNIDWILDVLNPVWRDSWPAVDSSDGVALVKLYAAAIKPYAREIFIPAVRPSEGFEGFSWWSQVKPRVEATQHAKSPKPEL